MNNQVPFDREAQTSPRCRKTNTTHFAAAAVGLSFGLLAVGLGVILRPARDENGSARRVSMAPDAVSEKRQPTASSNHQPASAAILVPVVDASGGEAWKDVPAGLRARCSIEDRMARLEASGGTPECEEAVVKGLRWLKDTQQESGAWPGRLANTGFALLAYFGHCETPGGEEFGDSCLRGITHLIDVGMAGSGRLTTNDNDKSWPYEHAINTYALAEVAIFCRQFGINVPDLSTVVQLAGQIIIDNQTQQGGWEYGYKKESQRGGGDLSITSWQLQALKACSFTGVDFPDLKKAADRGIAYVEDLSGQDGSFGYSSRSQHHTEYGTLTGAGVLCMQRWGRGSSKEVRDGAKYIFQNTRFEYDTRYADLYGHFFESQAMFIRGGEQWKKYNAMFRDQLVANQAEDGSWKEPGKGGELRAVAAAYQTDATYRTCLAILMLEVYYRHVTAPSPQAPPAAP